MEEVVDDEEEGHVFILGFRPHVPVVEEKAISDVGMLLQTQQTSDPW